MKMLVTGGAGFIGSNFVRGVLRETGHDVMILDKLTNAACWPAIEEFKAYGRCQFIQGDIADLPTVRKAMRGVDVVVNFAAETHVDMSIGRWEATGPDRDDLSLRLDFVRSNHYGVAVLLEASLGMGVKRFIQVSTDEVYGPVLPPRLSLPDDKLNPVNLYAALKAGAEFMALSYHKVHGLNVIVTRSANNYGPWQAPEKLIPLAILQALREEPIPLYGDGRQMRDWIHVEDNCAAILEVIKHGKPGSVINIPGGNVVWNIEVINAILDLMHKSRNLIRFVKDRPAHDQRYAMEGYAPHSFDLYEGLKPVIEHYREHQAYYIDRQEKDGTRNRIKALLAGSR